MYLEDKRTKSMVLINSWENKNQLRFVNGPFPKLSTKWFVTSPMLSEDCII